MRGVVCVVHVVGLEVAFDGCEVAGEVEVLGAWGAVQFAGAAENSVRWDEGPEKSVLVVGLGVANEGVPVCVSQPLAHAKVVSDARTGLGEESRPTLRGTAAAKLADNSGDGLYDPGSAAAVV